MRQERHHVTDSARSSPVVSSAAGESTPRRAGGVAAGAQQLRLFEAAVPQIDASFASARRIQLDATSWVEHVPGWLSTIFKPEGGDLIVMGGRCQSDWVHCVPKQAQPAGARVSVNFMSSLQARRESL
jgi:hypothetical protein